jgi:tetratricopeptide (TPR) repeat protein
VEGDKMAQGGDESSKRVGAAKPSRPRVEEEVLDASALERGAPSRANVPPAPRSSRPGTPAPPRVRPGGPPQPPRPAGTAPAAGPRPETLRIQNKPPPPPPAAARPSQPPPKAAAKAPSGAPASPWRGIVERLVREIDTRSLIEPARAALLLSIYARICVDGLGDPLRATQALTRAVELAPDARFVASTLRWLAEQGADPLAVLQRSRAELAYVADGRERVALLWHIGAIEQYVVGDLPSAKKTFRELLALDPDDLGARDALMGLHLHSRTTDDGWDRTDGRTTDEAVFGGVVEELDAMARATTDATTRSALYGASGALRDRYLSDEEGAIASLHRALEADEHNAGAQAALETILLRRRNWDQYAHVMAALAERTRDPRTARERFERAGDVYAECIGDHARAAHCYVRAATLAETDPGPLEKLAHVLERASRWEEAATAYERLLTRVHDPIQRAWTLVRLGTIKETRLGKIEDAFAAFRLAVDAAPTFAPAVQALIRVARARKLHALVIELERREAERIADPRARSLRFTALAEMIEELSPSGDRQNDIAEATALYERALALDAMNVGAFDALDRIFRDSRQWTKLIGLYQTALDSTADPRRARALRLDLAELLCSRAKEPVRAAELLREALTGPQDSFDTLVALARSLADSGKWAEHVEVLGAQAGMLTGDEEVMAMYRIGAALETRVKDLRRALQTYEIILDRAPRHEAAARAILRVHEQEGRWDHAIAAERKLLELATRTEDVLEGLLRIARISEEQLGRIDDAIAAYLEALECAPGHAPTVAALERLLRAKHDYRLLAQVLQRFADATPDRHLRVRAIIRSAVILELCLDDTDSALVAYTRALSSAGPPGDADRDAALWGLLRLQETRGEWDSADGTLHAILETTQDPTTRMQVLVRRGRNAELRLGDLARAATLYEEALTTPSSGAKPAAFAVDRLRVARLASNSGLIASCLNAMASATTDERLQSGLIRVLAVMRESSGGHEAAAKLYDRLIGRNPEDIHALDGLGRCLAATGDPRHAQALIARARATADEPLRAILAFAAGVLDDGAGRTSDAEVAYGLALMTEPELLPLLDAARRLRAQAGDWNTVAALSERAAKASLDSENLAASWLEAAEVYENRLGDPIRAVACYRALLLDQPAHGPALQRALYLLEEAEDWSTMASLLLAHVDAVTDPAVRIRCLTQRAAILSGRLGDIDGAIADLRRALSLGNEPDLEAMQALVLLEERATHWQEALQLHEHIARAPALDGNTRRRARLAAARIYADELRDDDKARTILEELVTERPDDRDTILRLAEVCGRSGHATRAIELYTHLAGSGSVVERARVRVAMADLQRTRPDLWPPAEAEATLALAFDLAIADPAAIPVLEERFSREGDFRPFTTMAEAAINRVPPNTPGILAMRTAIAKVMRERLGNPEGADRHLAAAIKAFPDSMQTRLLLAANLRGRNDEAALTELRHAVEADPTHPGPFEALVTLAIATGRVEVASMLASAAVLLGSESTEIEGIAMGDGTRPRPHPESLNFEEAMNRLVGPSRCWYLRNILAMLEPFLPKLFPGGQTLLEQRTRLPDSYPIVGEVRAVAMALGCPPPLVCRGNGREVALLLTEPRALVLGSDLLGEQARGVALFHAAYVCSRVAAHGSVYAVPRQQIGSLLDAAALPDTDGPLIRELRRRLSSVLPRKNKRELEHFVATNKGDIRAELPIWEAEESRRSLYSAVVLCRDMRAVAEVLASDSIGTAHIDGSRRSLTSNPRLREILEYVVSPSCWDLFKRVYGRP